ncbi:MAG TPA: ATP-binding protein [Pyrinomonadaceae bacterium]|nr:ATP-binding protein [Pyrinomonadaceae bacterium]
MRLRLNLQWKVLLLVAAAMTAIVLASSYLHGLITARLIESDRYNTAVRQTATVAGRITARDLFARQDPGSLEDLRQDISLVVSSRPEFEQIDVYRSLPEGMRLVATSTPAAERLPALTAGTPAVGGVEVEHPWPDIHSTETTRGGRPFWVITAEVRGPDGNGYLSSLVAKDVRSELTGNLQTQHNLLLGGAVVASVVIFYLLFVRFFRRPAADIVAAMSSARGGDLNARVPVHRQDELGEIGSGFNRLMDELGERDREREGLLTQISGFNEELRREVATATRELRAANESLLQTQQRLARSERLAAVGQIAASLAHEIGTPLNAISGHVQLLSRSRPDDRDTQRRVEIIQTQLSFIIGVVKSLLSRTQPQRAERSPVDLNALVRELLWLVKPTLDAHDISVAVNLAEDLPEVPADHDGLQQVLLNLVNNSVDAMPEGGWLEISTGRDGEGRGVELLFRDSGEGIPPAALDHVFEPMWTTKLAGNGFGLAIAREIMIEHGGQIEAVGGQGRGAAFRLTLPLAGAGTAARAEEVTTDAA